MYVRQEAAFVSDSTPSFLLVGRYGRIEVENGMHLPAAKVKQRD